jgi:hypothetical protein
MIESFEKNFYSALGQLIIKANDLCSFLVYIRKGDKQ